MYVYILLMRKWQADDTHDPKKVKDNETVELNVPGDYDDNIKDEIYYNSQPKI